MGKTTGFLEYERKVGHVRTEEERIGDFREFHELLPMAKQREQAARCMDCGIPFCQAGMMISGMASGCPLHNLVPEVNDLVYRGRMEEAYKRLSVTHSFPEFTSRVCPALCEAACTCNLHDEPVSTKENERTVIEYAYKNGLVEEIKPSVRTGKKVAVVGSGPSGLAAAQLLNRRGHHVTVFERRDRIGGLLRYGIPNMKLDKSLIDRRIKLMEKAGIEFKVNTDAGKDITKKELEKEFDAVILCCGASNPRDINAPGRDAKGIRFAVDFLSEVTKRLLDSDFKDVPKDLCEEKDVIVIGGGDTGNDCVGSAIRLGAKSVTQLEMMPCPPKERTVKNPWPEWPKILKVDYGQEEAIFKFGEDPRIYQTTVKEFIKDKKGNLKEVVLTDVCPFTLGTEVVLEKDNGRFEDGHFCPIIERKTTIPASRTERLFTVNDNQTQIRCKVLQGESRFASNNVLLGEIRIKVPKAEAGKEAVDVTYTYDVNLYQEDDTTLFTLNLFLIKLISFLMSS